MDLRFPRDAGNLTSWPVSMGENPHRLLSLESE